MKKELVIIAGSCYPNTSATGAIALKYADYLDDSFNIRLIAIQQGNEHANGLKVKNLSIYTLSQWRLRMTQISHEKLRKEHGWHRVIYHVFYMCLRGIGRLQAFLFTPDNCWWYQRKAYELLNRLEKEKPIDTILTFSAPIESHVTAKRFKKKNPHIRWVSYWGDLLTTKEFQQNLFASIRALKRFEKSLIQSADCSMMTEEIYSVLKPRYEHVILTPMVSMPYTFKDEVLFRDNTPIEDTDGKVHFVFMGSFYRKIRNPKYMLHVFSQAPENMTLDLYSQGNCDDIVSKYTHEANGRIVDHGIVSPIELDIILRKAHVLINIENSIETSNPSKLLQLMSYRKPIVNFNHQGNRNQLLEHYPLAIEIENGAAIDVAIQGICLAAINAGVAVPLDQMLSQYRKYTEENVRDKVISSLDADGL